MHQSKLLSGFEWMEFWRWEGVIDAYSEVWSSVPHCVSKTAKKDELCFIYILPQLKKMRKRTQTYSNYST